MRLPNINFLILILSVTGLIPVFCQEGQLIIDPPETINTDLVILGGDDAGLGAVWAAGELGLETVLVLTHLRDFGGDFTNFIPTDIAVSARTVGGINYIYDTFARRHTNEKSGSSTAGRDGRVAPPGPSIEFLYSVIRRYKNIRILAGYIAQPHSGLVDSDLCVRSLRVISEIGAPTTLNCKYVVDGTPEGYGAKAFDLPIILGREGQHRDRDPTRNMEAFAGRRLFATRQKQGVEIIGRVPLLPQYCDHSEESEDNSMGASPVIPLREYVAKGNEVDSKAPWLFVKPPEGFDPADFEHLKEEKRPGGNANGRKVWRFSGKEPLKSLPEWYRLEDGTHYLRQDDVWKYKRWVEKKAFSYVVRSMYYYQYYTPEGNRYGIDREAFEKYNAPYHLSDFGTSTYGGDQSVACRLYHRVLARLKVSDPLGGQMFFRQEGGSQFHEKSYWIPDGIGFPLLEIDYHTILGKSVSSPPGAGPEGSAFTYCVPEASGLNLHSLPRRCIEPDFHLIDNYLSPGTPATTFMAQAALRAGSSMNHLGIVAAAIVYLAQKRGIPVSKINTTELQWILVDRLNTAIVYCENTIAGTPSFKYEQLPGVIGIPRKNLNDAWQEPFLTHNQAYQILNDYYKTRQHEADFKPDFENDTKLLSKLELITSLQSMGNNISFVNIDRITERNDSPVLLRDVREILTRAIIQEFMSPPPYYFPDYVVFDSFNRTGGHIANPEIGKEWHNDGFKIYRGHAISDDAENTAWMVTEGLSQDYNLSVEICLEQKPKDWINGTIQHCGLLFDYKDKNNYGFFGIKDDLDSLKFVLEYDKIQKEICVDYLMASFALEIAIDQKHIKALINGVPVFEISQAITPTSNRIGLIHGPGHGRVHFQNFCQVGIETFP